MQTGEFYWIDKKNKFKSIQSLVNYYSKCHNDVSFNCKFMSTKTMSQTLVSTQTSEPNTTRDYHSLYNEENYNLEEPSNSEFSDDTDFDPFVDIESEYEFDTMLPPPPFEEAPLHSSMNHSICPGQGAIR